MPQFLATRFLAGTVPGVATWRVAVKTVKKSELPMFDICGIRIV